jgi:hypothetical protein
MACRWTAVSDYMFLGKEEFFGRFSRNNHLIYVTRRNMGLNVLFRKLEKIQIEKVKRQ